MIDHLHLKFATRGLGNLNLDAEAHLIYYYPLDTTHLGTYAYSYVGILLSCGPDVPCIERHDRYADHP